MTTITRESAEIKSFITGFLSDPAHDKQSSNSLLANVFRIALASLEAEPVAYIFKHPAGKLFWALTDESNKEQADVIPVYAAAPASVVPDNASEPLAYAYKELTPEIMRNHLAVFERYGIAPNDSSTTIQALRIALDGIERSDAMLHGAEPVSQTYKLNELAGNSPVIPGEVLSAILKVARVRADFDDFDGDRRGIGDCLDEAEQELIVTINKYASQLAAGPIAPNDVREQTAVPPVPVIQADVAQAIEKLKRKLVECNRYNYCADAVKGVEYACHAAMLQGSQPVSQTYKLPPLSSNEVNDAAWKLRNMLTEHGPLNGRQFNNLKGCFYEALKVEMRNYPVTPDSWISCSERMPKKNQNVLISVKFDSDLVEPLICSARNTGSTFRRGQATINPGNGIEQATHWMPLPEPPQEVNRG
ncbi:bacteriophage protein [Escherichia coli]|nr:bacteriophage protein [Escherichia coli]HCD5343466.1 DUF551 domain-containing protein [Escherichia coli]